MKRSGTFLSLLIACVFAVALGAAGCTTDCCSCETLHGNPPALCHNVSGQAACDAIGNDCTFSANAHCASGTCTANAASMFP